MIKTLLEQIKHELEEAPMNPTEFDKAVSAGQTEGVLVGFEFEVHMPEETMSNASPGEPQGPMTAKELIDKFKDVDFLDNRDLEDFTPEEFDTYFKFKRPINGFNNTEEAFDQLAEKRIDKVLELYHSIPEEKRADLNQAATSRGMRTDFSGNDLTTQMAFATKIGALLYNMSKSGSKLEKLGWKLRNESLISWRQVFNLIMKVTQDSESSFAGIRRLHDNFENLIELTKTPQETYNDLSLDDYEDEDYDDDSDEGYQLASKVLAAQLQTTMGRKVRIFNSYHESTKNMTDWYVEPDGSLEADNDGDASAEVVSPPLPAAEAIDALKKFYAMAQELKLYTNSTTGLHINVSIPKKLDVLKLAVFLGDQHVLKQFGRQDNSYSNSTERQITARAQNTSDLIRLKNQRGKKLNPLGQQRVSVELNMSKLTQLAKDSTSGHTDSISNNGKYISFRHAGGNYLADFTGIYNTVGRFIRAMIIASDPTAYADEYQKKLTKLANGPDEQIDKDSPADKMVAYLRKNGMPVLRLDIMKYKKTRDMNKVIEDCFDERLHRIPYDRSYITTVVGSQSAKNNILSKLQSPEKKQTAADKELSEFASVVVIPPTARALVQILSTNYPPGVNGFDVRNSYTDSGCVVITKEHIPANDPRTQEYIKKLLKQYFGK